MNLVTQWWFKSYRKIIWLSCELEQYLPTGPLYGTKQTSRATIHQLNNFRLLMYTGNFFHKLNKLVHNSQVQESARQTS